MNLQAVPVKTGSGVEGEDQSTESSNQFAAMDEIMILTLQKCHFEDTLRRTTMDTTREALPKP